MINLVILWIDISAILIPSHGGNNGQLCLTHKSKLQILTCRIAGRCVWILIWKPKVVRHFMQSNSFWNEIKQYFLLILSFKSLFIHTHYMNLKQLNGSKKTWHAQSLYFICFKDVWTWLMISCLKDDREKVILACF